MEEQRENEQQVTLLSNAYKKAARYHEKVPYLNKIPSKSIAIIALIVFINLAVWAACGIVLVRENTSRG